MIRTPTSLKVKKRDGRIVPFDSDKIKNAVQKAFWKAGIEDDLNASEYVLTNLIDYITFKYSKDNCPIDIEKMLDIVEDILINFDKATAKVFIKERFYTEMGHRFYNLFKV